MQQMNYKYQSVALYNLEHSINALCSHPHVKTSIRDVSQILTTVPIFLSFDYDELSDQGYSSLPKRYKKSDGLQVQLCWVGARRLES